MAVSPLSHHFFYTLKSDGVLEQKISKAKKAQIQGLLTTTPAALQSPYSNTHE